MPELKISCVYVGSYGNGHVDVEFGERKMQIDFDEDTAAMIRAFALAFVQNEQRAIAKEIAEAQPALLPAPEEADWEPADYEIVPTGSTFDTEA